jgi:hypothetical protein
VPTITIAAEVHAALKKAAAERDIGVGVLAESLLLGGIAKRERDVKRRKGARARGTEEVIVGDDEGKYEDR